MNKFLLTTMLSCLMVFSFCPNNAYSSENNEISKQINEHSNKGGSHHKANKQGNLKVIDSLLNNEQKVEAQKIREESDIEIEKLKKEMVAIHEKLTQLRERRTQKLKALLTPEQKAKLEAIKAKKK